MIKSNKKQKECFISCSEEKIKAVLCSCNIINSFKKLKAIKLDKNDPKVIKTLEIGEAWKRVAEQMGGYKEETWQDILDEFAKFGKGKLGDWLIENFKTPERL